MTLANRISILRLILIPVFVAALLQWDGEAQGWRIAALAIYIVAALSDAADGFVARHFNQKTRLGRVLDPLADKVLVVTAFIFLAVNPHLETNVPLWLPVFLLTRDACVTGGTFLIHKWQGKVKVKPRFLGKVTTVMENAAIIAVLLEVSFAPQVLAAMIIVALLSLLDYIVQGISQVHIKSNA